MMLIFITSSQKLECLVSAISRLDIRWCQYLTVKVPPSEVFELFLFDETFDTMLDASRPTCLTFLLFCWSRFYALECLESYVLHVIGSRFAKFRRSRCDYLFLTYLFFLILLLHKVSQSQVRLHILIFLLI